MSRGPTLRLALALMVATACDGGSDGEGKLQFPGAPVLLISIDTLRADRLGCYGYDRGTSPHLDALAQESVLFEDVYAPSCKTAESHMSLFTSLPVSAHGVTNASVRLGVAPTALCKNRLTLGQMLRRSGYWNTAVACGGNLMPDMGFVRGFEGRFDSRLRDVSEIVDLTLAQIDAGLAQERPVFAFMHTYQVHGPYVPPPPYLERFAPGYRGVVGERVRRFESLSFDEQFRAMHEGFWEGEESFGPEDTAYLSDLYDGEIAYTDAELGRLLDALRQRGVLDRMLVVVFSDHGEEFAEHGEYQHDQLYRESLHVPLLVRLPGGRLGGTRVEGLASLVDVLPTLVELLALEGQQAPGGRSLVTAMQSKRTADEPVLAERTMFAGKYLAALRTPAATAHFAEEYSAEADRALTVYDTAADPGELQPLPGGEARTASLTLLYRRLGESFALRAQLDADPECQAGAEAYVVSPEQNAELNALGYVEGSDGTSAGGTPLDCWPEDGPR